MSGVSKERVTLWSGCIGLKALAGFLGQRPKPLGRAHNYESEACSYSGLLTDAKSQYSINEWVVYAITERSNNVVTIEDFICMLLQIPF